MAAESPKKCQILSDNIAELLGSKIQVGDGVIEYIDSTYGNPTFEEIQAIVDEQDGSEKETLMELIFFPDESVQVQLEEVLEEYAYTSEDVASVASGLADRDILATVALGDTGRALNLRLGRTVIDPFLTRLNITYTPDADLNRTIAEVLPADVQRAVRVRLRNSRLRPAGNPLGFLLRYIRATSDDGFFFEGLDFLLEFMQEIGCDADIFEAMMRKKGRCCRHLNKVEDVSKKLSKNNFETLILRGERFPYIDRAETLKTIAVIDRICLAVFGKTETIEAGGGSTAGCEIRDAEDAAAMIRRLAPKG